VKKYLLLLLASIFVVSSLTPALATNNYQPTLMTQLPGTSRPTGIAADNAAHIFVSDNATNRWFKIDAWYSSLMNTFIPTGSGVLSSAGGVGTDVNNRVFICSYGNSTVKRFDGTNGYWNFTYNTGRSNDVAMDYTGWLYVVDMTTNQVRVYNPSSGGLIKSWGGTTLYNGEAMNEPLGISVYYSAAKGWGIFVADSKNNRILKFDPNGVLLGSWGSTGSGNGQFNLPVDTAVDAAGNVFVADYNNNRIQKFGINGNWLASFGSAGYGTGQFNGPRGVCIDPAQNHVWVADYGNRRVSRWYEN
jgi:streptogramin lyase